MFQPTSRYAKTPTYLVTDRRGRQVTVVAVPPHPAQAELGVHLRREGERLDHLAFRYLGEASGWWSIAELADAVLPDQLFETREVRIPRRGG
jgi:hypothetical protein